MKKALILGASGLLGLNLALEAKKQFDVLGVIHQQQISKAPFSVIQADLLDDDAIQNILTEYQADIVINCVALANLEACEKSPDLADALNHQLAGRVAHLCKQNEIAQIHISTDAVFDGEQGDYRESDAVNPLSVYARSKLDGEEAVRKEFPDAIIARVNFFGWSLTGKRSLAEFFYNNLASGRGMKGITDRYFNPLHVTHLSQILLQMLELKVTGTFHIGSPAFLSKYEFGMAIAERFSLDGQLIEAANAADLAFQAVRSPKLTMNVDKLLGTMGKALPDVYAGIRLLHEQLESGYRGAMLEMAGDIQSQESAVEEKL